VHDVTDLADWLRARDATRPGIVLDPEAGVSVATLAAPAGAFDLLIGPEGGLTADEVVRATRAGFTTARMGPRVLRTETASLAALAALNTLWGDFR